MRQRALILVAAALFPVAVAGAGSGCGSKISVVPGAGGSGGEGGRFLFLDGGGGTTTTTTGPDGGMMDGDLPDYEDPGCPDQPPPIEDFQCDPYAQNSGDCLPDEGCYIFVDYPNEPCGQEVYGSTCLPSGNATQGEACNGALDCAAGFVCVISGSGTQCVELCSLTGPNSCPPGLVCEPIDVVGYGGCL